LSEDVEKQRLEQRLFSVVIAICLALGGWWLQNQWEETRLVNQRLEAFIRHVDDTYVDLKYIELLQSRLARIENKLDELLEKKRREMP
jgi:low affinity Fe/Cu permease